MDPHSGQHSGLLIFGRHLFFYVCFRIITVEGDIFVVATLSLAVQGERSGELI